MEELPVKFRLIIILFGFIGALSAVAAPSANLLQNGDFSQGMKFWTTTGVKARIQDGGCLLQIPEAGLQNSSLMSHELSLAAGEPYRLSFQLETERGGVMRVIYQNTVPGHSSLGLVKEWKLTSGIHTLDAVFHATTNDLRKGMTFNFSRLPGRVHISAIHLVDCSQMRISPVLSPEWQIFCGVEPSNCFNRIPEEISGKKRISRKMHNGTINLRDATPTEFRPGKSVAVLYNRFTSDRAGVVRLGFSANWFFDIYLNGRLVTSGIGCRPLSFENNVEDLFVEKGENLLVAVVRAGSRGWQFFCGIPREPIRFRAGDAWKPYQLTSSIVKPGSALDLGAGAEAPAGRYGRLTISKKGELVFEKRPEKPVRLLGFNGEVNLFNTKDDTEFRNRARLFAQAARRQGYRLFRVHALLDYWLCFGAKEDMQINPVYLDRWDFLVSELKKEGIYLHLVLFSFGLYTEDYSRAMSERTLHKLMMYLDGEWELEHFRFAADTIFRHVNPYTGVAWKDEPAIAFVEYYNEQSLGLGGRMLGLLKQNPDAEKRVLRYYRTFLEKRYGRAFPDVRIPEAGGEGENDFALFWMERAVRCAERCEKIVREAGYPGLVENYSHAHSLGHSAARWKCSQVVDVHAYFNHPSNWTNRGSQVAKGSSIEAGTAYWRDSNSTKLAGRPFLSGEFNHCFWNPYRYETGLVFGGYSALQGYGALEVHDQPVILDDIAGSRISCFNVGASPLLRAAQFLTACLFQRGDVRTSPNLVSVIVPRDFLERDANAEQAVSSRQASLGLLTGYGLCFPEEPAAPGCVSRPEATLSFPISGSSAIRSHDWFSEVIESKDGNFSLNAAVTAMKQRGILSPQNISAPEHGVFQSDTEEITLRTREKKLTIQTPRTEGVCLTAGDREELRSFSVERISSSGCVALCSIDGKELAESTRMVLLYMTEEANTDMELGPDHVTLRELGTVPVLCRAGKLELSLRRPGSWKLYALGVDGCRRDEIPVQATGNCQTIRIDTGTLSSGPTPFFELIADPQ